MLKNILKLATISIAATTLSGCCITMPKFFTREATPKQASPCATQQQSDENCCTCCEEKNCAHAAPVQNDYIALRAVPLHKYGWTPYQRRYGSAAPTVPAPIVIVPSTSRRYR